MIIEVDTDEQENIVITLGDESITLPQLEAEELLIKLDTIFMIRKQYKIELDNES